MRARRSIVSVLLFIATIFFLILLKPRPASALENRPPAEEDDDYHDHYHDHSHDEHNFDEEGHKHTHWEL
jgi:ABC-type Zn2+ transport system substrate-binding protein/surface adhesin